MRLRRLLVAASLLISLLVANVAPVAVRAETETDSTSSSSTSHDSTTPTTDSTSDDTPQALAKRLEEHKAAIKVHLKAADQVRLQAHCKAAQVRIKVLQAQLAKSSTHHGASLTNITTRLTVLVVKIKAQGVDTTTLTAEMTTLASKVATYKADLATYSQAIKDLAAMDCTADPAAFKATLEAARTKQTAVRADFKDITTYVQQTIKPALTEAKANLAAKSTGQENQP